MFGLEVSTLAIAFGALVIGGIAKGITGIGLPIISIAILVNFLPPTLCIAIVVIPILVTNFWQAVTSTSILVPIKRFWPTILCFITALIIGARLLVGLDAQVLYAILGVSVLIFSASNLFRPRARAIKPATERWLGPLAGVAGGLLGGISTIWGPPLMMFLMSLHLKKDEWVRSVGLIWFAGAVPLTLAFWANGILNGQTLPLSIAACVPGMIGILIGERIRGWINQDTFRKVMLSLLFLIGLNLIRRALFQ
ncbi:MAG: sulfite exporter TauE/SafE family protein [Rhodospirillales bacterium]|nr:sulfite exporter TauE/SafE family protein [Rhodospirillales bacterium]